jgi:isopropylmalate/homocitrate/citramalate synthase
MGMMVQPNSAIVGANVYTARNQDGVIKTEQLTNMDP